MLGLDRCYPRPRRKDCDPSGVDILFGLPSGGVAGAQPPANGLNPFGVPWLSQRLVYNDERSSVGMQGGGAPAPHVRRGGQAGFPRWSVTAIKLRIFPFAPSLSKGERENPTHWKLSRSWFDKLTTNGLT
ncbi:MAG: hypothetical protein NTX45_17015 [Proteobacteria bacterium]|nr:hypothetical protein [Pseudomonadota bacterium]